MDVGKEGIHCCGYELAKVNGRNLRLWLKENHLSNKFGRFSNTEMVEVCPKCHASALRTKEKFLPFLCADGVMRIVDDDSVILDFCGFRFSCGALNAAVLRDSVTKNVEMLGANLGLNLEETYEFSKEVCAWGRGHRVWGNLIKGKEFRRHLNVWIVDVKNGTSDDSEAIEVGAGIKGLGVSFASKHLRMIDPERFAVLDFVLSNGLGFALNTQGYLFFLRCLRVFQNDLKNIHSVTLNIATIESGIFGLIRQQVRAR